MSNAESTPPAADPTQYDGPRAGTEPQISFWRRPFVLKIMPLMTSFAFHAGILAVAIVLIRTVPAIIDAVVQEQVIIPEATMTDTTDLGPLSEVSMEDETEQAMQDQDPTAMDAQGWKEQATTDTPTMDSTPDVESSFTPIGQGLKVSGIKGDQSAGKQSRFGPATNSKRGMFVQDSGKGGNARKIVYLCDASGSIGTSAARKTVLISQLKMAVDSLKPTQFFNVVFFSFDDPIALSNGSLMQATPGNRQKAYEFLDKVVMSGQTDPIPALKLAFKQDPELVYLLTDGEFTAVEPKDVIETIKQLNSKNKVAINTIMLDNESPAEQATLKEIASMTGGIFKSYSAQQIIREGR